jgi:hypothetical protein
MKKLLLLVLLLVGCDSEVLYEPVEIQTSVIEIPEATPETVLRAHNGNLWVLKFKGLPFGFSIPKSWEIVEDSLSYKVRFGATEHSGFMTVFKEASDDAFQDLISQGSEVFYNDGLRVYCDGLDGYLAHCVIQSEEFDGLFVIEIRQSGVDLRDVISSIKAD